MSIWRNGYTIEIALFHVIGVVSALIFKLDKNKKELLILTLLGISYLSYLLEQALFLSMVYPFVISYYNVAILQTLIKKDLKTIAIYMIFIGWMASGLGLFVAIEGLIILIPIIFLMIIMFKKFFK
jgi:hypothetical protein